MYHLLNLDQNQQKRFGFRLHGIIFRDQKTGQVFLLDQNQIAGIGNICDEVLWQSKIHPETPTKR